MSGCTLVGLANVLGYALAHRSKTGTYQEIRDNIGELHGYLHEVPGKLFKPDDDTAVPMILIRALQDYGEGVTAQQLGDTLLNYIGDEHGTFWWGGYGVSTEHTAYLNLRNNIPAPQSGSIAMNGAALAEQIGGQIFSDIWGLVAPNSPELAADLAERAASVTHDGNGIFGGRFIAALVSQAFSERDPANLIESGLAFIPAESEYARVVKVVSAFHQQNPDDWEACFAYLKANFGYDRYPGVVHIIPNAGVIVMGLLYGGGDFSRTLQITNMAGWDTDCNVGNVGAIMGVALGLEAIDAIWRDPINDLLIAASVIGTRNLLTVPQCADLFCQLGRDLANDLAEQRPRYHFKYSGSTNNFQAHGERGRVIELRQVLLADQSPVLQASLRKLNKKGEARIYTRTYYRPEELSSNYYEATFTPLIYAGQTVSAEVFLDEAAPEMINVALYVYDANGDEFHQATAQPLRPGQWQTLTYTIPFMQNACLSEVGIVVRNTAPTVWGAGAIYIKQLDWDGIPNFATDFSREWPESGGISQWTRLRGYWRLEDGAYDGSGVGLCESYTGDIAWKNYTIKATLTPLYGHHHNINGRVQGALRSYAFGLAPDGKAVLYKKDDSYTLVASADFDWLHGEAYELRLSLDGGRLLAHVGGHDKSASLTWQDASPYLHGQIGVSTWHGSHTRLTHIGVSPEVS